MIFATDLDRTMIYSSKFLDEKNKDNVTLIEKLDGKYISYISNYALKELEEINNYIYVIPVTTRSIKQYKRIETFEYCKYAITTNGGTILYKGKVLKKWEEHILKILENYKDKMEDIINFLLHQDFITREPSLVDGKFIFTKTDDVERCENVLEENIDKKLWNYTIQGQKVYVIPKEITKSDALKYLKEQLNQDKIIASGDGKMDKDMLDIADYAIMPKHGELYLKHKYTKKNLILVDGGIFAADQIIKNVKKINNLNMNTSNNFF